MYFIFARFHASEGEDNHLEVLLKEQVRAVRQEDGCLEIHAYRSVRDARTFYIHSRWRDEAAFDLHAGLSRTERFVERAQTLIDHPLLVTRANAIA